MNNSIKQELSLKMFKHSLTHIIMSNSSQLLIILTIANLECVMHIVQSLGYGTIYQVHQFMKLAMFDLRTYQLS